MGIQQPKKVLYLAGRQLLDALAAVVHHEEAVKRRLPGA
jgi:hypothetical protein